ncbi:MAG: putative zinc-binding protein [Candidatus Methanosuratincola sp.]
MTDTADERAESALGAAPKILRLCCEVAEHESIIWVCDGAANVGQIGHEVGALLTNMDKVKMCCTTAVAAGSKPRLEIAGKAKRNIVIDRCGNRCAPKKLDKAGVKIGYATVISKYLKKVPTLDLHQVDVNRIAEIVTKDAGL